MSFDALWQPSTTIPLLQQRAQMIASIRQFFSQRGYLEVETPIMARYGVTDVYLSNIQAQFREKNYCLQTSPEYHMKRLLAAGSGPIFQLARVFRDDELGRWHNPEFTLLEWYQLHCDHYALMDEMDLLLKTLLNTPPMLRLSYQEIFLEACDLNPLETSISELRTTVGKYGLDGVLALDEQDKDQYLFLLMSHLVEPFLAQKPGPVAVYNFPPSQAALAKIQQGTAERFEVYYQGVELANGFHELTDPKDQAARFKRDLDIRQQQGLKQAEADLYLLQALEHGLPPCSGVALGIDRLLALALKQSALSGVLSFDFSRA